jgi:hypothetical protein
VDAVGQVDAQYAAFGGRIDVGGFARRALSRSDFVHHHQRCTDEDRANARTVGNLIALALDEQDRRDHGRGFTHQQIEIEVDQCVARSDSVPGAHMRGEAAPAQPDGIDAEVDQDLRAVFSFDRQRMAGRLHADDAPGARRIEAVARRIDRQPVAQHPPGKHRIGDIVQRSDPAL